MTIRQFVKFSIVGGVNTLIHSVATIGLVELFLVNPVVANTFAFLIANSFSYWANSRWSFRAELSGKRFARFVSVSVIGLLITIGGSGFAEGMGWHYLIGLALVISVVPIVTFVFHKSWTFSSI